MKKYTEYTIEELKEMTYEVNGYDGSLDYLEFYHMEDFNELLNHLEPLELAEMVQKSSFNIYHNYFIVENNKFKSFTEKELNNEIKEYADEIVERYNELVESGDIEELF